MKLIAYRTQSAAPDSTALMGVLAGDRITPLTTLDAFYKDTQAWRNKAATATGTTLALADVTLAVPVPSSAKIICAAINYVAHGAESKLPTPQFPNLFARWASTLSTSGTPVVVPATEPDGLDWEVELAVIVGSQLLEATAEQAERGVLGYTPFNDISGRASQIQSMTLSTGQWAIGKNLDNSGAVGSVITTSDVYDPRNKRLTAKVDGAVMQDGTTADLVFDVPTLIQFITRTITLNPGDLIATGTPAGVGFGRNPRVYAKAGSVMEVEIEDLGVVSSPIVAAPGR